MNDDNEPKGHYQLARVKKTNPSEADNIVRKVVLEFKNISANTNLKNIKMKEVERNDLDKNIKTKADLDENVVDVEVDLDEKLNV